MNTKPPSETDENLESNSGTASPGFQNAIPLVQGASSAETLSEQGAQDASPQLAEKSCSKKIINFSVHDQEYPPNWPIRLKLQVFFGGMASVINSTLGSSLPSLAIDPIADHFHVTNQYQLVLPISCYLMGYTVGPVLCGPLSENYGRKPVFLTSFILYTLFTMACAVAPTWASLLVFRLFSGICASAPVATVGATYADIWSDPVPRGAAMAWFMAATALGPVLAPPLSGFISESVSWRWVFGVGTFFALATVPFLFLMPESYAPVLLSRRAARLRKETGNPDIIAASDLQQRTWTHVVTVVMTRPYRMLFQEAIVACVCLYALLTYSIFYLYFEAYPIIFLGPSSVYHFSPGLAGLTFLPIGLGAALCAPIFMYWDKTLAAAQARGDTWSRREEYRRLPLCCLGGPLYAVSLLWIGWSARPDVHWLAPTLSGITFGMGFLLIFMALLNYLSDAYTTYSASAQGIASTCRSVGGAVLPLASRRMFRTLGIAWACSLLAFLSLAVAVIPFVFIRFGETIRRNSKFCQELRRLREEEEEAGRRERGAGGEGGGGAGADAAEHAGVVRSGTDGEKGEERQVEMPRCPEKLDV